MEEPNLVYLLDMYEAELIKDKIKCINTATSVWLGAFIPEQATLKAIEQTLLESKKFKSCDMSQIELITKNIILHPGNQAGKGVHAVHVITP